MRSHDKTLITISIVWCCIIIAIVLITCLTSCSLYLGKGCRLETEIKNSDNIRTCVVCDSTSYYWNQNKANVLSR